MKKTILRSRAELEFAITPVLWRDPKLKDKIIKDPVVTLATLGFEPSGAEVLDLLMNVHSWIQSLPVSPCEALRNEVRGEIIKLQPPTSFLCTNVRGDPMCKRKILPGEVAM